MPEVGGRAVGRPRHWGRGSSRPNRRGRRCAAPCRRAIGARTASRSRSRRAPRRSGYWPSAVRHESQFHWNGIEALGRYGVAALVVLLEHLEGVVVELGGGVVIWGTSQSRVRAGEDLGDLAVAGVVGVDVVGEIRASPPSRGHALVDRARSRCRRRGRCVFDGADDSAGIRRGSGRRSRLGADGKAGVGQMRRAADDDGVGRVAGGDQAGEHLAIVADEAVAR